ncbi:cryptochrome DASH [Pseudoalteromonas sp. A25]|uniref:DASH family cryptochrome n=1 Tax=Pseudoalteromonas sp. A25 TaxID=116092 RepID=UPI0012608377|nr:DASH family cryptochrome [Pseudoalteromonas sp. A25]BBN81598.1 cryptochrome DASH [Pseudoalteromonas sp. A25]
MSKALYWFTHDLRLTDNHGINLLLTNHTEVAFIYIVDPQWFRPINYQQRFMGAHRWRFLKSALEDLQNSLNSRGHYLYVQIGDPQESILRFVKDNGVKTIYVSKQFGTYEKHAVSLLERRLENVHVHRVGNYTLFNENQINHVQVPLQSFSAFRKYVEQNKVDIPKPTTAIESAWPAPLVLNNETNSKEFSAKLDVIEQQFISCKYNDKADGEATRFIGGEYHAINHVTAYFSSSSPASYKQTRNELDGWNNSTKFSSYLALGNISPRYVWHTLKQYEKQRCKNDSTYWIGFELLWREYFQWLLAKNGRLFFLFKGNVSKRPLTSFYPQRFAKWCSGQTPYPLVNACMNQLNRTGYISNRARQIVASCLVNELAVDWRYGAAYFQKQLIDHDVASNWGNWQYIAGVGVDPRGGRHFDINKQTHIYDKNGLFITKWHGERSGINEIDSVDLVDWPAL